MSVGLSVKYGCMNGIFILDTDSVEKNIILSLKSNVSIVKHLQIMELTITNILIPQMVKKNSIALIYNVTA